MVYKVGGVCKDGMVYNVAALPKGFVLENRYGVILCKAVAIDVVDGIVFRGNDNVCGIGGCNIECIGP